MHIKRILLAEDDFDDQHLFRDFLGNREDICVMPVVENGVDLLECLDKIKADQHLPHLIILDQNMPKRNGLQTLQLLKAGIRYAHIPVMIYSTYADQQLSREGVALGAALVMSKPITRDGYHEMIDAFLNVVKSA